MASTPKVTITTSQAVRQQQEAQRKLCVSKQRQALEPSGFKWDASNQTPSRIEAGGNNHGAIRCHEDKLKVIALRACGSPKQSVGQALVWIRQKK